MPAGPKSPSNRHKSPGTVAPLIQKEHSVLCPRRSERSCISDVSTRTHTDRKLRGKHRRFGAQSGSFAASARSWSSACAARCYAHAWRGYQHGIGPWGGVMHIVLHTDPANSDLLAGSVARGVCRRRSRSQPHGRTTSDLETRSDTRHVRLSSRPLAPVAARCAG